MAQRISDLAAERGNLVADVCTARRCRARRRSGDDR
jgi:hypothetical protein